MKNTRRIIALVITLLVLGGLSLSVAANTLDNSQAVILQDCYDVSSALAYGLTPAHL